MGDAHQMFAFVRRALSQFGQEVRLISGRAVEVWRMVPWPHKRSLLFAASVMTLSSLASVAIPLSVGWLINSIQTGVVAGVSVGQLTASAFTFLGVIVVCVLTREGLGVARRY